MNDRKVIIMIRDLVNISIEEIKASSEQCAKSDDIVILYLQNNGDKSHFWDSNKLLPLINEDIDA